jgi:SOS response associated peptidase (SRAP)
LEAGSLCGELDKLEMSAMFPKPIFPKPGTAEFDEFVREMEEFARFLTDPKECFRRADTPPRLSTPSSSMKASASLSRCGGDSSHLVVEATQGIEAGNVQRSRRDSCREAFLSGAFMGTRCLIPVSGYYEWQDTLGGKQPWYFTARDGSPALTIAGLWDEWRDNRHR